MRRAAGELQTLLRFPAGGRGAETATTAHGELLLLEMGRRRGLSAPEDHFVYMPAGAARPLSLSLLPVRDFLTKSESSFVPYIVQPPTTESTGLLRRGEDDVLVVQVHMWFDQDARRDRRRLMAEFCVLRPGMLQWELMELVPILHDQRWQRR